MASQDYLAIGSAALNTSTGTQDLTISGLGWTPTGAIFFLSRAAANRTHRDGASTGIIFADDNGQSKSIGFTSGNAGASSTADRYHDSTDATLRIGTPNAVGTALFEATVDSDDASAGPISNGWRIDVTGVGGGEAYIVKYILIGNGADCVVGDLTTAAGVRTVTPGIQADLGFFIGANEQVSGFDSGSNLTISFGAHGYDGTTITQGGVALYDDDGAGTTSTRSSVHDDQVALHQNTSATPVWEAHIENITSTQFDINRGTGTASNRYIMYLVVDLPAGVEADVSIIDTPTSTGSDWTVSGVGFQPDFALLAGSTNATTSTIDGTDSGLINFSGYDGTTAFSIAHYTEDNVATTNTSSYVSDEWIDVYDDDGSTQDFRLDPSSSPFNSDGWTVANADITTADSTARKWVAISVGEQAASSGPINRIYNGFIFQG